MKEIVLFILLDAFRTDYIYQTKFLRSLAMCGLWGRLHEPFGFCPRAAYFGGLTPEEIGYSHMFIRAEERHPFKFSKVLSPALLENVSTRELARNLITNIARERCTEFEREYLTTGQVPLDVISGFELAEKYAPWDEKAGYKSLFHQLNEKNYAWMQCAWPYTNSIDNVNDKKILEHALKTLSGAHRFAYLHFSDLDHMGHHFGPESRQIIDEIAKTDSIVETVFNHCRKIFELVHLVIIGDHGMAPVQSSIDLYSWLHRTGLKNNQDYQMFIDSTMARFWYTSEYAGKIIERVLSDIPGTVVVNHQLKKQWRIEKCPDSNGQLILLAHPGMVFIPNYFQTGTELIKGMHGYDPEHADNSGIFLVNSSRQQHCGRLPDNDARVVYSTLCDLLRLDAGQAEVQSALKQDAVDSRMYISSEPEDKEVAALIDDEMTVLIDKVTSYYDDVDAIVLQGSYGRGEGQLLKNDAGLRPVNDMDILIVGKRGSGAKNTRELADTMKSISGLPYYDITYTDVSKLPGVPPSIYIYDLLNGSRVIWGDRNILNTIPRFAADEIPVWDGVELLLNRCTGILIAVLNLHDPANNARNDQDALFFLENQLNKAWRSLGDWQLLKWKCYHSSYLRRAERYASRQHLTSYTPVVNEMIILSYKRKYVPASVTAENLVENYQLWRTHIRPVFAESISMLTGQKCSSVYDSINAIGDWSIELRQMKNAVNRTNLAERVNAYKSIMTVLESESFKIIPVEDSINYQWRQDGREAVGLWEQYCH